MPEKLSENDRLIQTYAQINRQSVTLAAINLVYQESMRCESLKDFGSACLRIVESITASRFSFIGEMGSDGLFRQIAISETGWEACSMHDQSGHHRRLENLRLHGLYGAALLSGKTLLTNSPRQHPQSVGPPDGHPPIESFLGVPFVRAGETVGMIGVANRPGGYSSQDQEFLESVAPTIIESLLRKRAEQALRESESTLAADLAAMARLQQVSTSMLERGEPYSMLPQILDAAIGISGADKGMLQVMGAKSGKLQIKAQRGFDQSCLQFFAGVDEKDESPYGQVLRQRSRVIVDNLAADPIYGTPSLKILNSEDVKSLACTPLLSSSGLLAGVLTIFWRRVFQVDERVLRLIDLLARQAAEYIVRIQTEQQLLESQSLLRAVMDGTPDAVYVKDSESRILMCNPALAGIVGLPIEEIVGKTDTEYYGDVAIGQMLREHDLQVMSSGKSGVMEETALTPDGYRIFLSAKAPLRNASGEVIGTVGISHDITDRKRIEESLRQARNELEERVNERTAELSQTVWMLNEEVNKRIETEKSLRERSGQLRLMASELTMAEQRERQRLAQVLHDGLQQVLVGAKYRLALVERSQDIRQSTSDVAELIDDAIETSRSLTAELSPPILHQGGLFAALEWLARWMHDKHGLNVDLLASEPMEPPPEDLSVFLFQAVRELLFNVIKHAGRKTARVQVSKLNGSIRVAVMDEGAGFDPAQLRAAGGSVGGFGLFSISERLGLLGGEITIDSAPGRGSRITLIAPLYAVSEGLGAPGERLSRVSVAIASQEKAAAPGAGRKIRVALVDDHMVMRQGLAGLLRAEADMEIVGEASDGASAVNLVRDIHPDVVLMDITMPGMDGIQATRIIHSELPAVHVIGLSMFEEGEQAIAMRDAGAVDYLTKSGPSDAVVAAIRSCLKAATASA